MTIQIEKVIQVNVSYNDLQKMTSETNISDFWADICTLKSCKHIRGLITNEQFEALETGAVDYIIFREDY